MTSLHKYPASARGFVALLVALLMAWLVYTGASWGLGLTPDSVAYSEAARWFSQPSELQALSSQWPPLFSATLAAAVGIFGNLVLAGRCLQALFGALTILLLSRLFRRCGISSSQSCLLLLLLVLQTGFLHPHLMLWSEPEFLVLALLDLLLLDQAIRDPERKRWIVFLALTCGAATLVRYAGLFLLPMNALGLLAVGSAARSLPSRLRAAAVVSVVSVLPFLGWIAFNRYRGASAVNRALVWHPPGAVHWRQLQQTLTTWFHLPSAFSALVLALIVAATVLLFVRHRRDIGDYARTRTLAALYLLGYCLFILVSISFIDEYTPLDERILFPALPILVVVLASIAATMRKRWLAWILMLPVFVAMLANVGAGFGEWQFSRTEGIGFANRSIQTMPVLGWLDRVPANMPVLTNGPELFQLYLGRSATMLPAKYVSSSGRAIPDYPAHLTEAVSASRFVVYFYPLGWREYLATPQEIDRLPGLQLVYSGKDAAVWYRPGP